MASFPGPYIPQPTDILGQYAKVVALRNALQQQQYEQQMRPLQLQQEQQAVQLQQQQLRDAQAGQAAYGEWDGKDYNDLASLIVKHGGSINAANQAAQFGLNVREKMSTINKNQAETLKTNNDVAAGKVNALTSLPDNQLQQAVLDTANEGIRAGWLDQQHYQTAQQLAQLPPQQLRAVLPTVAKGFMSMSQQADWALKQPELQIKTQEAQQMQQ
jgi:hypothetical protein